MCFRRYVALEGGPPPLSSFGGPAVQGLVGRQAGPGTTSEKSHVSLSPNYQEEVTLVFTNFCQRDEDVSQTCSWSLDTQRP